MLKLGVQEREPITLEVIPVATRRFERIEGAQKIKIPNPKEDGLMPIVLNLYKLIQPRIHEKGYQTHAVVSRGHMTLL